MDGNKTKCNVIAFIYVFPDLSINLLLLKQFKGSSEMLLHSTKQIKLFYLLFRNKLWGVNVVSENILRCFPNLLLNDVYKLQRFNVFCKVISEESNIVF